MLILQFCLLQIFGAEFTNGYLKNLLANKQRVNVHVSSMSSKRPMVVRMMMAYRSNSAVFTIGWDTFVRRFKLKEDDNILFCFNKRDDGELNALVEVLPGC